MPGALATGNMVATCYITVIRAFVDSLGCWPRFHVVSSWCPRLGKKVPDSVGWQGLDAQNGSNLCHWENQALCTWLTLKTWRIWLRWWKGHLLAPVSPFADDISSREREGLWYKTRCQGGWPDGPGPVLEVGNSVWLESKRYILPGKCPSIVLELKQQLLIPGRGISSGDHNNGIEMIKFCLNQKTAKGTDACVSYCKQIMGVGGQGWLGHCDIIRQK